MCNLPFARSSSPSRSALSLCLVIGLSSCASAADKPARGAAADTVLAPAPETSVFDSPATEAQYHVLAGEMAAGRHMPEVAAEEFLKAVNLVPDTKLAARATGLALAAKDESLALAAAHRWLALDSTSLEAREVIALVSVRKGLMSDAYAQCAAIVRDHPGGQADGFRHVAMLLAPEADRKEQVLALLQKLVDEHAGLAGAHYALGLLALRFQELDLAEKAAREALKLEPHSTDTRMLLAGVLLKKGELDAADAMAEQAARGAPNAADLRMGYARLLLESQQRDRARRQLQLVLKAEPGNADARFGLGLMALEDQKLDEAAAYFKPLAEKGEHQSQANYYLGRIEESRDHPERAYKWYQKVSSGNQAIDAAVRAALMLGKLKRIDEARSQLAELRNEFPPLAGQFFAVEGELLLDAGRPQQALEVYEAALAGHAGDADLLYGRSLVYERLGRVDLAEADLRRILTASKDDARAMNALGYLLTLHNSERLAEAQQLLDRALQLEPNDAAVIDSMGWLQFKLGHLDQAKSLLKKAYEKTADPEIAAHLGEVLWTLGDKDEARAVWQEAQHKAPDHQVLKETMDRLEQ